MSPGSYDEGAFETHIETHLTEHGEYETLPSEAFDRERALFPDVAVSFVKETQPEKWAQLETAYQDDARDAFLRDLTSALERQGTLDVVRHGLRTTGTTIHLAAFQPNTGLNPEVQARY